MKRINNTTIGEEIFNAVSHGIGSILALIALIILILISINNYSAIKFISFVIYGSTLFLMYLMSTLFHSLTFTKAHKVFKVLDHSSIYLFIAGSFTPFILLKIQNNSGYIFLFFIWLIAILGIVFKAIFINKSKFTVIIYLILGWLGVIPIKYLSPHISFHTIAFLGLGGVLYTLGTIFYSWKKLYFNHGYWHLFVLAGSIFHFVAVLQL